MEVTKKVNIEVDSSIKVNDRIISSNSGVPMNQSRKVSEHSPLSNTFLKNLNVDKNQKIKSLIEQFTQKNQKTRDKILWENIWLVAYLSKPYQYMMDVNDLHSAGVIGLIEGIKHLDKEKMKKNNTKASTYLRWWVLQGIREVLHKNRNVSLPTEKICKQVQRNNNLDEGNFFESDFVFPEVSLDFQGSEGRSPAEVADWYIYNNTSDGFIEDTSSEVETEDSVSKIKSLFDKSETLTKEERKILIHRFGLKNQEGQYEDRKTLREVASITGMSYEGVRKVEKRALGKLYKDFKNVFTVDDLES